MSKPSDEQLAAMSAVLSAKDIAVSFGVHQSTAARWLTEYRERNGESRAKLRAKAAPKRSKAAYAALADEMLDLALATARQKDMFVSAKDMLGHAKLCLELHQVTLERSSTAVSDDEKHDRSTLIARMKKVTASAEQKRKGLHVVAS